MFRLAVILILSFTLPALAQIKVKISGAAAVPTGYTEDAVSLGYGGTLNLSYPVFYENFEISFSSGYYFFGEKENLPDYDFSFKSIPVLLGARFNFAAYDVIPYIGVEGGVYFSDYLLEIDYGLFGRSSARTIDNHWGFSAEAGLRVNLNVNFDVDVSAKYHRINTVYIARSYLLIQTGFMYRL